MNARDIQRIARSLGEATKSDPFRAQSPATVWAFAIGAVADALAAASPEFDRAAFLEACRAEAIADVRARYEMTRALREIAERPPVDGSEGVGDLVGELNDVVEIARDALAKGGV